MAEERQAGRGRAALAVTYRRDRSAVAYVIEVLKAILEPAAPVR